MTKMSDENVLYYQGGTVEDKTVTNVIIATGVTKIDKKAFFYCKKIQSVVFEEPHQVTQIGWSAFYGCHALESIELPKSLKKITSFAFRYCHALRRIVIPGRVTSIGVNVFEESGIEEIVISDGIESIPALAFADCPRLHTIRLPASLKEIHLGSFDDCPRLENVLVPADGLPLLKTLCRGGSYESCGWEVMCKISRKAPNLKRLYLSSVSLGGRKLLDDSDIPLMTDLVSSCPHLESLNLSENRFSDQAIRIFDSQGILGRLQNVNFRHNCGSGSTLSSNEFLNLLQKNPCLAIWTSHKWENPKDECLIRHYLDMNHFGCRGVPIKNVSIWPRLIHRLGTIGRRRQLKTCPVNVLFHLLREENFNDLCLHYQQNRMKWHQGCQNRIGRLEATIEEIKAETERLRDLLPGPGLLDEEDGVKDNEGNGVKRRRLL